MNYIQKSSIKTLIKTLGFRVSASAFDGINRAVKDLVTRMVVKVEQDGMKTLMEQHTSVGGAKKVVKVALNNNCKKCCNIKPEFLKFAKSTQDWCHTKATILSRKV